MILAKKSSAEGPAVKRFLIIVPLFISVVLTQSLLFAQFKPEEIAQRERWEEFLKTADIIRGEPIGEGVTHPWKLYLKQGDIEKKAAWKNPDERHGDFVDSWKNEIAAYRLDKLIGLNMVPPTIEREYKGRKGALSLWADNKYSLLDVQDKNIPIPDWAQAQLNDMKYLARLWACLIANDDLTQQNIRYTEDWRTILIDHSRSFWSSREYTEILIYGANGIKRLDDGRPVLFRRVPRWIVERIKILDFGSIKRAVGPYLTDKEITSVVARKKLIVDEINEMIREQGESKVLY